MPLEIKDVPKPKPKDNEILVRLSAAALNHRDLFQRQLLYPAIVYDVPLCADGVGYVEELGKSVTNFKENERVLLAPGTGWDSDPVASERPYNILGGNRGGPGGTLSQYICVDAQTGAIRCPEYLSDVEAAALPLAGVTAYRAVFTKGLVKAGSKVIITGIGGGVALIGMQMAVAEGADVWVTSGSEEKIQKAVALGAKGGINYKSKTWAKDLVARIPGKKVDTVIDSAGGDTFSQCTSILKVGGIFSCYGMTLLKPATFAMPAVLKNLEFKGSTMGSFAEFKAMVGIFEKSKIKPVVEKVFQGLEGADDAFGYMKSGSQFGKIVVTINSQAKL